MDKETAFQRFASTSEARKDLRSRSISAFASILGTSAGEFILRIVSTAILAHLISPNDFGLFMMVTVVTSIADQFRDLGLSTATIQREKVNHKEVSNLFWINVAAGSTIAIAVLASAPLVAAFFEEPRLQSITCVLASCFVFGGLTVQHEALMARQLKHFQKSMVRVLAFLFSTLMAIPLAWMEFGYWALVWREVARAALIVVGVYWICPWVPSRPDRQTSVRSMVGFGANLTATYILGVLSSCVDRLLIGRYFGAGPVALYRQPYQLVVAPMSQFMSPLYQVALPSLSMLQDDPERYRRSFRKVISVVAAVSMPLNVFLAVYAYELTHLMLGVKWIESAAFLRIFAIGGLLRSVVSCIGFVPVSRGNSQLLLKLGMVQSAVMAGLMALGMFWGPQGVAVGEATTALVMMLPWAFFSFRGSPVSMADFFLAIGRPLISALIVGAGLVIFRSVATFPSPALTVAIGGLVAGVGTLAAWLATPGGRDELRMVLDLVRSKTGRKPAPACPS